MTKRKPKPLPPPTDEERAKARVAAAAMRAAIADPSTMGAKSTGHLDFSRPRRGVWFATWANTHECLPGWEYARREIKSELIPDLDALAEHGIRPTEATS